MIGYNSEHTNFIFEIVYNYGNTNYDYGNEVDCVDLVLNSKDLDLDSNDALEKFEYPMKLEFRSGTETIELQLFG